MPIQVPLLPLAVVVVVVLDQTVGLPYLEEEGALFLPQSVSRTLEVHWPVCAMPFHARERKKEGAEEILSVKPKSYIT